MSWTINRQQQFRDQPADQISVWIDALLPDNPGNYIRKKMQDCTGEEICEEWLYHMGVPTDRIHELASNHCNTIPVMMPYVDAFFMPRELGDRPDVVPDGAVNFAFIGQFAEEPRDTIFTTEYSMPCLVGLAERRIEPHARLHVDRVVRIGDRAEGLEHLVDAGGMPADSMRSSSRTCPPRSPRPVMC